MAFFAIRIPNEYSVEPESTEILREHRQRMLREQAKGLEAGWMSLPRKEHFAH